MMELLEFFNLQDTVPLLLLICLLEFVGKQMSGDDGTVLWWARGFAGAGFLCYAAAGIDAWHPTKAGDFLLIGIRALLAMGTVHGLARVLLPIIGFFYRHLWAIPAERHRKWMDEQEQRAAAEGAQRAKAEQEQAERERQAEAERRRAEELARRPPPPTREERLAAAKQRYDSTLGVLSSAGLDDIELTAAKEKAKQQYLRELDEALK